MTGCLTSTKAALVSRAGRWQPAKLEATLCCMLPSDGASTHIPMARKARGACRMLRASAAVRIDGGMVLRVQLIAKQAEVTHIAG